MSKLAAIVAGVALFTGVAVDAQEDANLIVKRADLTRSPGDSFVWTVTITSTERDKAPAVHRYEVYVRGTASVLVRFVSPPRDVGKSLLALGRDLWIYLPDAGKPVRIPFSQRLVGQVANGDIARVDYAGDYTATLVGSEAVDGVTCYVLDLKANSREVTYAGIKYWVAEDGFRPMKAEYYAGTGTLLKTGTFDQYRPFKGRPLATRLTLADAIRKDRKSVMEFSDVLVRDLPEKYFNKSYMKSLD